MQPLSVLIFPMKVPEIEIEVVKPPVPDARLEVRIFDPVDQARHNLNELGLRDEYPEGIVP